MERMISIVGLLVMLGLAWLLSSDRRRMDWRLIASGVALQFLLGAFILKTTWGKEAFNLAQMVTVQLINYSDAGAQFLFGNDFQEHFFAFKVLPTIIFISSLSYALFYLGVLQRIVEALSWVMTKAMRVSGVSSLVTAANVFVGQTEAPLFVAPYIKTMTRAEIMTMMTSGMATVAGGVLAAYVGFGISAGHLLAASIMSAPAAIVIARIIIPETEAAVTGLTPVATAIVIPDHNIFEAACRGASDGLKLALNVGAMLIAFLALLAMINGVLAYVASLWGGALTLQEILGWLLQPLAWVMGVPWHECQAVGQMLGTKMVLNEFVAYIQLGQHINGTSGAAPLSERATVITTYALCGFANFSSVAIQIGGIGNLEPSRRSDFAVLGLKAMLGGTLAAFMTACIAGALI